MAFSTRVTAVLLFLAVFTLAVADRACSECDHVIQPSTNPASTYVTTDNSVLNIPRGGVICFSGALNYATGFFISNFVGTAAQPYTLTNCDGVADLSATNANDQVSHGIILIKTSHLNIIGDGKDSEKYGIKIHNCAKGLGVESGSSDVEVSRVEIYDNVGHAAVTCKTDPSEDNPEYHRPTFVLKNPKFHDMYIHDIATEAFYIGYFNYERVFVNGGGAHDITGLRVYNNIMKNIGWDAIQVGCAISDTQVYNNIVENYGTEDELYQNSGIFINTGFKGSIYNNYVNTGTGAGITYHGQGDTDIYNNVIVNAGGRGITTSISDTRTNPGTYVKINHNSIISSSGDRGISANNPDNGAPLFTWEAYNNVIIYSGYSTSAGWACVNLPSGRRADGSNICSATIQPEFGFTNVANDDYSIKATSSFVDAGDARASIASDIIGTSRPQGAGVDIGAYEYTEATATTNPPTAAATDAPTAAVTDTPTAAATDAPTAAVTGPGLIPAESFVDRIDITAANQGGQTCGNSQVQADGNLVDLELAKDSENPGGCNVGWIATGESLTYDVTFSGTSSYTIDARVSGKGSNRAMDVYVDDEATPRVNFVFVGTGGWQRYKTISASLGTVTGGAHKIRVEFKTYSINLHFLDIYPSSQARGSITSGSNVQAFLSCVTLFMCIAIQVFFM